MISDAVDWERLWAPYDEDTYDRVLGWIRPGSAVLDIGAGDLRLARRTAGIARVVYAIEIRPELLVPVGEVTNLHIICGDARSVPFPEGIDTAVLLMRHCTHFALFRERLEEVGCERLITNARWGMGVECIDLKARALPYDRLAVGWYACRCGATGFRPGPAEAIDESVMSEVFELSSCPRCCPWSV